MLLALALAGGIDCDAFVGRSAQPIETKIEKLSGPVLDPQAKPINRDYSWETPFYQIGKFIYQGNGYSFRSTDKRFPQVVDSVINSQGSICHYQIIIPTGYDAAKGKVLARGQINFELLNRPLQALPGLKEVDKIKLSPYLAGYVLLSSQPIYTGRRQIFIGLMRPADQKTWKTTAIVAFSDRPVSRAAIIIANIEGRYSGLTELPIIHGTGYVISIDGRELSGSLRQVDLVLDGPSADEIAAAVGRAQ